MKMQEEGGVRRAGREVVGRSQTFVHTGEGHCAAFSEAPLVSDDEHLPVSYFFCQVTGGARLSKAASVLRDLIYDLAPRHPELIEHVRGKWNYAGKEVFDSAGAWHDLCEIATVMLEDPRLHNAILIVDALDECSVHRARLLDFNAKPSSAKWIVSSRNWPDIEDHLADVEQKVKLHLELNQASVSRAVESYVKFKLDRLAKTQRNTTRAQGALSYNIRRQRLTGPFSGWLWFAKSFPTFTSEGGIPLEYSNHSRPALFLYTSERWNIFFSQQIRNSAKKSSP